MMQFLTLYTPITPPTGAPPSPDLMAEMGKLVGEMTKAGTLVTTAPLQHSANTFRVRLADGACTVAEDPFGEARASGFALLQANSKADVVAAIERFLRIAGDGECKVLPVMAMPPPQAA
jgi:hypothetical protein